MPLLDLPPVDYRRWRENADPAAMEIQRGTIFPELPLDGDIDDFKVEDIEQIIAHILG
jgi:hypothetical protein